MIVMLDQIGDFQTGQEIAHQAMRHHVNQSSLYFNYANLLGKMSWFEESERYFKRAINLSPSNALYHANLAVLYHRWNKWQFAFEMYEKALELDSNLASARENLNGLLKIWKKEGN
jgi:tetratricopeptide (TPR) repeat protein